MVEFYCRLSFLVLVKQPVEKKENSELKTAVFSLEIDSVSHTTRGEEVG